MSPGERTWTICEECDYVSRDGEATCDGNWLSRREHDPVGMVPLVELSRLRAAEEERDTERTLHLWLRRAVEAVLDEYPPSNYSWARRLSRALHWGIPNSRDMAHAAELAAEIPPEAPQGWSAPERAGAVKAEADIQKVVAERDRLAEALKEAWDFLGRDRYYAPPELEKKVREALAALGDDK